MFVLNKYICRSCYQNTQHWTSCSSNQKGRTKALEMTLVGRAQLLSAAGSPRDSPQKKVSSGCTFLSLNTNNLEQDLLTGLHFKAVMDLSQRRKVGLVGDKQISPCLTSIPREPHLQLSQIPLSSTGDAGMAM